jgi:hypothetical protein
MDMPVLASRFREIKKLNKIDVYIYIESLEVIVLNFFIFLYLYNLYIIKHCRMFCMLLFID